ncbi:hypothetical protein [Priestia endophytica]|uniref:hypothetical protein n=1 Tax=Priestia endophytica TaxID=135735 RepID=UPI00203BA75A|nr:hypothetical protein [Priestia endophytica]MCM3536580.1 hypothetical protein [Priestia endophytica]
MTINIHYVRNDISVILSDRRFTYGLEGEGGHSDDNIKLSNLKTMGWGWTTGAGLYNFIIPFQQKFSKANITKQSELIDLFNDVMNQTMIEYPQYKERMMTSSVSFSFLGLNSEGTAHQCQIGLLDKTTADKGSINLLPPGCLHPIPPSDFTGDLSDLDTFNQQRVKKLEQENLHAVIIHCLEAFEELSRDSMKASEECDIGICKLSDKEMVKLKLSGNVYDLLNKLNEGTVEDYMEEIEKLVFP